MTRTRREFISNLTAGVLGGTTALGLVGAASFWPGSANNKTKTLTFDIGKNSRVGYIEAVRKIVHDLAKDAIGKPEKGKEMSLLRGYIDVLRDKDSADNVMWGYGTFTGPRSNHVSVVDSIHWLFYGEWGTVRDPIYWAQRDGNGEWYII